MRRRLSIGSNIAGPFYSARHGRVLEDAIHYICDLCGNRIEKKINYSSFSQICVFPGIQDHEKLECPICGETFYKMKIERKFYKSNKVKEYEITGSKLRKFLYPKNLNLSY